MKTQKRTHRWVNHNYSNNNNNNTHILTCPCSAIECLLTSPSSVHWEHRRVHGIECITTTTPSSSSTSWIHLKRCIHSILVSSILSNQCIRIRCIRLRCELCQHEESVLRGIHLRWLSLRTTRVIIIIIAIGLLCWIWLFLIDWDEHWLGEGEPWWQVRWVDKVIDGLISYSACFIAVSLLHVLEISSLLLGFLLRFDLSQTLKKE